MEGVGFLAKPSSWRKWRKRFESSNQDIKKEHMLRLHTLGACFHPEAFDASEFQIESVKNCDVFTMQMNHRSREKKENRRKEKEMEGEDNDSFGYLLPGNGGSSDRFMDFRQQNTVAYFFTKLDVVNTAIQLHL